MLITNNIYAQENKITPKWPITAHLGANFDFAKGSMFYGQGGVRIWWWHVIGGSFGGGYFLIENEIDRRVRGKVILEKSGVIYYTGFYGIQTPVFRYESNDDPCLSG